MKVGGFCMARGVGSEDQGDCVVSGIVASLRKVEEWIGLISAAEVQKMGAEIVCRTL